MGIVNTNKQINENRIDCEGTLRVKLALTAAPDITANPADIVLVLDRSGSMAGNPLKNMKAGAEEFIDIIDKATDGAEDGAIGSGSRIGIVSFANTATANTQLITSVSTLKAAVNALNAGGSTNHADAFSKAMALFSPQTTNHKVIVLFTDGKTTAGAPPAPVAATARAAGIEIYCIGLIGADGVDVSALNDWATDPDASHVSVTPDDDDLKQLFADLAANITKPGATNVVINETVNPDFEIVSVTPPAKGSATALSTNAIRWQIAELGGKTTEGAALVFTIRHIAKTPGVKLVNQSVNYTDAEGNAVTFPAPVVEVDCGAVVCPEPCPAAQDIVVGGCSDSVVVDMGDVVLESLGRIVQMNVTVKNVCPHKRVALGVILTEVDAQGHEHARGMKALTIPAHHYPTCRDVVVKCIKFVLPEDETPCAQDAMCGAHNLKARCIVHNIDTDFDFTCCESTPTV